MEDVLVAACVEPRRSKGGSKPPVSVGKIFVGFLLGNVGETGVSVELGSESGGVR